ncbi:GTPase-associated protein 1-related protein [Nocardiopsis alba]|uniref:GTPase-associated protein 1-related protein n=1 Tax=Nocardiopsis alba TaxID=53437 RepID=UPI003696B651
MSSPQLYYTSCERGLSGCTGYQFNAATPGVDTRVLREVERFTVYEPPRALPPDEVHRHPINLCYSPDLGGAPVLSRVVSSGDDPSGRPGNYFAHSLVLDEGSETLPAELWGASFWTDRPVTDPRLPGITLPPGPLDRRRTSAWLRDRAEETIRGLLVSVDAAIEGGAPVLLIADDEATAHWVAALSHLLPPPLARRMSFATYSGNPEETLVHVMGVPPGTDTRGLRGRFVVFDPDRPVPIAPPPVHTASSAHRSFTGAESAPLHEALDTFEEGPIPEACPETLALVSLLVHAGVEGTPALWAASLPYSSGREGPLSEWRPLSAAAFLADGSFPAADPDLRAVRAWLPDAVAWLAPGQSRHLLHRLLDADPDTPHDDDLARLREVAHRAGDPEATERLEGLILRRALDGIAAGASAPAMVPMRSAWAKEEAGARIGALLEGGLGIVPTPDRAVELLRWAGSGGVPLPRSALERYGAGPVAHRISASPPEAEPDRYLTELLAAHSPIRRGVAHGLAVLPRRNLARLAAGPTGALMAKDREPATALLRELRMLELREDDPPELLRAVMDSRREARPWAPPRLADHDLDRELLLRVWGPAPGPETVTAALSLVDGRTRIAPDVGDWCARILARVPPRGLEEEWHHALTLVGRLMLRLPESCRGLVEEWAPVGAKVAALRRAHGEEGARLLVSLAALLRGCRPVVETVALRRVCDRVLDWDHRLCARVMADCPSKVFDSYCEEVEERLGPIERAHGRSVPPLEADLAVRVFLTALRLGAEPGTSGEPGVKGARVGRPRGGEGGERSAERGRTLLDEVMGPSTLTWSRREAASVRKAFDRLPEGQVFESWARGFRDRHGQGGLFGRFRKGARRA